LRLEHAKRIDPGSGSHGSTPRVSPGRPRSGADLDEDGRRAFAAAASAVDVVRHVHAVIRYACAVELVERTREEWAGHGSPLLLTHTNGALVIHPLVRPIRDLESDAAIARRAVLLEPATGEKRSPGGQMGRSWAKDRRVPTGSPLPAGGSDGREMPPVVTLSRRRRGS
jgi:hypothetical protein